MCFPCCNGAPKKNVFRSTQDVTTWLMTQQVGNDSLSIAHQSEVTFLKWMKTVNVYLAFLPSSCSLFLTFCSVFFSLLHPVLPSMTNGPTLNRIIAWETRSTESFLKFFFKEYIHNTSYSHRSSGRRGPPSLLLNPTYTFAPFKSYYGLILEIRWDFHELLQKRRRRKNSVKRNTVEGSN